MEILTFIIPFLVLITVVVFIHEYGHYYFAKLYGVGVTDFSIGFGKELFGFKDIALPQFNLDNIEFLIKKKLIQKKLIKPLYLS